jgi:hypothetical protein
LTAAAEVTASEGWAATVGDTLGVPTLAVASPAAGVTSVMEHVSEVLAAGGSPAGDDLDGEMARALGLAERVTAETVSVALALPPEVEEGVEAAGKFFGSMSGGGVRTGAALAAPGLAWKAGEGPLPGDRDGGVAVHRRRPSGSRSRGPAVPRGGCAHLSAGTAGRFMLAVAVEGGAHVPALDTRLASLWKGACRPATAAETAAAARRLLSRLYGDAAQATARTAAGVFLPLVPTDAGLLGMDAREVTAVLTALPRWEKLARFARGRAPQVVAPPPRKGAVRESASPH